jgi:hypothetical protein
VVRYDSAWKKYTSQTEKLEAFRMKTASLIVGQITPVLLSRLEQLPEWAATRSSQDPLKLFELIERYVLNQTKDAYPYKIVMDYMTDFCNYRQPPNLSDAEYSDTFNSTASIHQSVCTMSLSHHPVLLNYVSQELYKKDFDTLINADDIEKVMADNCEHFLAYNLIRLSNAPHSSLRDSLHNNYIQGSKRYPKKRSAAQLLLEQTTKTPSVSSISEGSSFAQKGGTAVKKSKPSENPWANKDCTHCGKKGHNPNRCFKKNKPSDGKKSTQSVESKDSKPKSSNVSVRSGISRQDLKKFTTVAGQIMADLTDSGDDTAADDDAAPSHFQYVNFMTLEATTGVTAMNYMFKQSTTTDLDLRNVILLDIFLVSTLLYVLQLYCANVRRSFPLVDTLPLQLIS